MLTRLQAAGARLATPRALRACDRVGRRALVRGHPRVDNRGRIEIGADFSLSAIPAVSHLVTGPHGVLEIGSGVEIGHGAAIAAHESVRIGDGTRIAPHVIIMDTDFHSADSMSSAGQSSPIVIGPRVCIGARVTILRGSALGAECRVAAGSVVSGHVAAGVRVSGVPARTAALVDQGRLGNGTDKAVSMERIRAVVARSLGLAHEPEDTMGPSELPEWDSLATLNLMLSLEDQFGIELTTRDMFQARCVRDLLTVVSEARIGVPPADGLPG